MIRSSWRGGFVLLFLLFAGRASAQSVFVEGGVAIDARRFSGGNEDRVFDANTRALTIGGAGFVTPIISAGVEMDFGAESTVAQSTGVTIAGRPNTVTTTFATRRRTVSALFGVHTPATHIVRASAYAGVAFTAFRQRISNDAAPIVLSAPPPESVFTSINATPLVGVDVAFSIAPNIAIVGTARAQAMQFGNDLSGFSVRPGAAVRVSF